MTLVVFNVVKFEVAWPEMFLQAFRVFEHPEIAVAHLRNAPVRACLEQRRRDQASLYRLHRLMPEYPRLPIMPDVLDLRQRYARLFQTEFDRSVRKAGMMLLAI